MQLSRINKTLSGEAFRASILALIVWGQVLPAFATTPLGDRPIAADVKVPGNVALALSVEWPTVSRSAYAAGTLLGEYRSTNEYYGYFDRNKCYLYRHVATDADTTTAVGVAAASLVRHFEPAGLAAARTCGDNATWSGNFLNWATGQAIDPFRWAMTGGNRVVDTPTETVIQKAWHAGQGLFPDKSLLASEIAGATPFTGDAFNLRINGAGFGMRFSLGATSTAPSPVTSLTGEYYNRTNANFNVEPGGADTPTLVRADATINFDWGNGSPGGGVNNDNFVVIWTGTFTAPETGNYRFETRSDDGVRLRVNGNTVIDRWVDQGPTSYETADIPLTAGQSYPIRFAFYERSGGAYARLRWRTPGSSNFTLFGGAGSTAPADLGGTTTDYDPSQVAVAGTLYDLKVRVRVCDSRTAAGGVEANCVQYRDGWKPEGLVQRYSRRMRFSAFGYMNQSGINRDGGVMRASQKFVGPVEPVPGSNDIVNPQAEWDPVTGVMRANPNGDDVNATLLNYASNGVVADDVRFSGVMNYLNKFGQVFTGNYKSNDPVSEMYYTALRYLRGHGNVSAFSAASSGTGDSPSAADMRRRLDGFPVITDWQRNDANRAYRKEPIQYYCQRNFILGIGDIYTHRDKNLPTNATFRDDEPNALVTDPLASFNVIDFTNRVGQLEGLGNIGSTNSYSGRNNSAYLAGMAYWANTNDIRPDMNLPDGRPSSQTVQTYWVDVLEGAGDARNANNQFKLATKYGGFEVPEGFDMLTRTTALEQAWWTNGETVDPASTVLRPQNYFTAGNPEQMIRGLTAAFEKLDNEIDAFTTSFSTSLPQLAETGNMSFSSRFDARDWSSDLIGSELRLDPDTFVVNRIELWNASTLLNTMVDGDGWSTRRKVITFSGSGGVPFRLSSLSAGQRSALDSPLRAGDDSEQVVSYLRGDRRYEVGSTDTTVSNVNKVYRPRRTQQGAGRLLGDIVGSKLVPVPAPNFPYSDAANPGYSLFKNNTTYSGRRTVVYAGANDGMLHAFDGSASSVSGGGRELFAYIPSGVYEGPTGTPAVNGLAALVNPTRQHRFYVNATPHYADVDFRNTRYAATETRPTDPNWRTILIGGLGKGGRSYYALDITDTEAMVGENETDLSRRVLWEFTDPDMGFSFGEPIVTKTKKYGWTVIFTSGYNNTDGRGYFFLVNPRTGELLEKISTETGTPTGQAGLATAKAAIPDYSDNTADAVYAGDLLGNFWRLDLTGTDVSVPYHLNPTGQAGVTAPVPFAVLTDSQGRRQPVTSRAIIESPRGSSERMVTVGTGRFLDESDTNDGQQQSYYAFKDGFAAGFNTTANSGVTFPIERSSLAANTDTLVGVNVAANQLGWYIDFPVVTINSEPPVNRGYRVIGDSDAFEGLVAFAAVVPVSSDPCAPSGNSRVYVTDLRTGRSTQTEAPATVGGPPSNVIIPFNDVSGVVTDLRFVSVDAKARLLIGNDRGDVTLSDPNRAASGVLRRLNWRELPLTN